MEQERPRPRPASRVQAVEPEVAEATVAPGTVACARCSAVEEPASMMQSADGAICVTCFGLEEAEEAHQNTNLLASPVGAALTSMGAALLFWAPLAGGAFVVLAWVFALLALRETGKAIRTLQAEGEPLLRAWVTAGLAGLALVLAATSTWWFVALMSAVAASSPGF